MIDALIVGAGPVGLYTALLLARNGLNIRIIEKNRERKPIGKAVGINAKTLELFQEIRMSSIFIEKGAKLEGVEFYDKETKIGNFAFSEIESDFNFLLSLPQSEIEAVFEKALENEGLDVERGVSLSYFTHERRFSTARISYGGSREFVKTRYIIGADGGSSLVRDLANISMCGLTYPFCIELIDLELKNPLEKLYAKAYVDYQGAPLLLIPTGAKTCRIVCPMVQSSHTIPYDYLPDGEIVSESEYVIQKKIAKTFVKKNVILIGDAAHIISPVGGRGMNLGFEDAYYLARTLRKGRSLKLFAFFRKRRAKKVAKETHLLTKALFSHKKRLKRYFLKVLFASGKIRRSLIKKNMGL